MLLIFTSSGQESNIKNFKKLSCPEKRWVIFHPFVAKKAYNITEDTRKLVEQIKRDSLLKGTGNGLQVDAFRHVYWMATLSQKIGWRKAKKLGKAHEKGNYKDYKKRRDEDGMIPDKISSEMDLYNNNIGIEFSKGNTNIFDFRALILEVVKTGKCKIIKVDKSGNYLDCDGNVILPTILKGKWINNKCLINSDEINF